MPSSVSTLRVTKLRPGEVMLTYALRIFTCAPGFDCALLIDAAGQESAIDRDDLPGDEGRCFRREIDGRACDFFCLAESAHGRAHDEFFAARGSHDESLVKRRGKNA